MMRNILAVIHWLDANEYFERKKSGWGRAGVIIAVSPRFTLTIDSKGDWRASIIAGSGVVDNLMQVDNDPNRAVEILDERCADYAKRMGIEAKYYLT